MKNKKENYHSAGNLKWEVAYRRLSKLLPQEVIAEWIDQFELKESGDIVEVIYPGQMKIEEFREKYENTLDDCLSWAFDREIKAEFRPRLAEGGKNPQKRKSSSPQKTESRIKKGLLWCAAYVATFVVLILGINFIFNRSFEKTFYPVSSEKIDGTMRVVQLSDLNGSSFGSDNEELIKAVDLLQPDLILLSGNMTGTGSNEAGRIAELCRRLAETAQVYYVYGDSEIKIAAGQENNLTALLESVGVRVLENESDAIEVNGNLVDIYGFSPAGSYELSQAMDSYQEFLDTEPDHLKISVVNDPGFLEKSENSRWGDIVFSGGRLGGEIRLPYVGALYEKENGFFPEKRSGAYMAGRYEMDSAILFVSRGLEKSGLRIQNRPEIVITDISRY